MPSPWRLALPTPKRGARRAKNERGKHKYKPNTYTRWHDYLGSSLAAVAAMPALKCVLNELLIEFRDNTTKCDLKAAQRAIADAVADHVLIEHTLIETSEEVPEGFQFIRVCERLPPRPHPPG